MFSDTTTATFQVGFQRNAMEGSYYRYFGGLTTPGCEQVVEWTVFDTPIGISATQVDFKY